MRFRLRTLLILLALGPPVLWAAWLGWHEHLRRLAVREAQMRERVFAPMGNGIQVIYLPPPDGLGQEWPQVPIHDPQLAHPPRGSKSITTSQKNFRLSCPLFRADRNLYIGGRSSTLLFPNLVAAITTLKFPST
jgi:hypothetical protein